MSGGALPPPVSVAGVPVHPLRLREVLSFVADTVREGAAATILYANAHACNLAARDPRFRAILWSSSLVFCDGKAVQWASRLLGSPLPERFTPPDWIHRLAEMCAREGWGMYFLGGRPGVAAEAAERLCSRYPGLHVDSHHGYFDRRGRENRAVLDAIRRSRARILVVGLGMPIQEYWVEENRPSLPVNVVLTVGAMFDYTAGRVYRAPRWAGRLGLEWLVRLLVEPRRLWRRYLLGNPAFVAAVLRQRLGGTGRER